MEFWLNGKQTSVTQCDAETTLLRYLRTQANLPGTKEGCGSGDCGACTVLIADSTGQPRTVNSCITPLGSVAGCGVVTVEGLSEGSDLHPAQQAMVDQHGSQCGFCTPGFVMSLAGLYERNQQQNGGPMTREAVTDAIAGNLCRCTGYRPIVDAGLSMQDYAPRAQLAQRPTQSSAPGAADTTLLLYSGEHSRYYQPDSEAALQSVLQAAPSARLVAGGTDFMLEISQLYRQFDAIVDVSRVQELTLIEEHVESVSIGAAVTYAEIMAHPLFSSAELAGVLHRLGSQQIRNRAGLGGNLANGSPIADTPPILLCWEASVELVNGQGQARRVALDEFYLGYRKTVMAADEYIRCIHVPLAALERPHRFAKLSKRFEDDISSVLMAVSLSPAAEQADNSGHAVQAVDSVRIAYGGMAATPARAPTAEALLLEHGLGDAGIAAACDAVASQFQPLSDVRASAEYRSAMAASLLGTALRELRGEPKLSVWTPTVSEPVKDGGLADA